MLERWLKVDLMLLQLLDHKLLLEVAEEVVIEEEEEKEAEEEIDLTLLREKTEVEEAEAKEDHQDLMQMVSQ